MGGEERKFNEDSIVEYMTSKLKSIQKEKTWTNEQMGHEFAELLTKEQQIVMIKGRSSDSSGSESSDYDE